MTLQELSWVAGLLEGEGSFHHKGKCVIVQLSMTDRDVVAKAAQLIGSKAVGYKRPSRPCGKPMFYCYLGGDRADVLMQQLLPFMGERRSMRIRELLELRKGVVQQHQSTLVCSHTAQYRRGRTVCDRCYKTDWSQRKRAVMPK